ncbi:DUF4352 domain-containing protein [Prescottella sp. R16]|uniref:DUF4352 domain-containing protein n=1 Tax=Prescottella sp. R16 TaxID=3064529 RepID=UPI00272E9917|nr:DUF4352 domain-containing protein [Prescottella sp. R16]
MGVSTVIAADHTIVDFGNLFLIEFFDNPPYRSKDGFDPSMATCLRHTTGQARNQLSTAAWFEFPASKGRVMSEFQGPNPQQFPPQPGYGVPPVPPKKKSRKWPWVVGAIVAVFVIAGVAGGGEKDAATPSTKAPAAAADGAPAAAAEETPAAAGVGTPVRDGKFEFTVTNVESGLSYLGDNPILAKKAQGQFVVVTMTVSNTSGEPKGVSPSDQKLFDTEGREFSADTSAALNLDTDVAFWDKINPGNAVTLKMVYDMPAGAVPASMELHDSMFSGGVDVALQ